MQLIKEKMLQSDCSPNQIRRFLKRVENFLSGSVQGISESSIESVDSLPRLMDLEENPELLRQVAMVKLNGGLGTSMGLTAAKGLLEVKDGLDFYAILYRQMMHFREKSGFQPPLVFMNSFNTANDTEARLEELGLVQELPTGFMQSQVPKITSEGDLPDCEERYAWCPPGHGDIYASLLDGGFKQRFLEKGIRYLFVSNIDNLGAVLDSRPLALMKEKGFSFLMEVTRRGPGDKKGGHLARDLDGQLLLREVAQCPSDELEHFQNIEKHRFFNTNNLWIDLERVSESWTELPLIVNRKPVIPHQADSPKVVQLEQAMGAAIGVVENSGAIEVSRDRFLPVKTTNDLLLVRSDCYRLNSDGNLSKQKEKLPKVDLDTEHFKMIQDFERLVVSLPSLLECESLKVDGPMEFSSDMSLKGHVHLRG